MIIIRNVHDLFLNVINDIGISNISTEYRCSKYVLSLDKTDFSQNGIIHKNIIDWLLEE